MIGNLQYGAITYGGGYSVRANRDWIAFRRDDAPIALMKFNRAPSFNNYTEKTTHYQAIAQTDSGITIVYTKQVGLFKQRIITWPLLTNQEKHDLELFIQTVQGSKYTFNYYGIRDEYEETARILNPNDIEFFPIEYKIGSETEFGWASSAIEIRIEN